MSITAPATNPASDLELKLPATIGTANQVLKNSSTPGTLEFGGVPSMLANSSSYEGLELQTPTGDGSGEFHIGVHQAGSSAGRSIVFKRGGADGMDTESMRINNDGVVTTPHVPCFWYAGLSNTHSNNSVSSSEVLVFSTEKHNNGSHYNTSNGRFTAPVAGAYQFGFNGILDDNTSSNHKYVHLYRNGSNVNIIAFNYHNNGQYTILSGSAVMYMAKDDYATIYALAGVHIGTETSWWGTLIG